MFYSKRDGEITFFSSTPFINTRFSLPCKTSGDSMNTKMWIISLQCTWKGHEKYASIFSVPIYFNILSSISSKFDISCQSRKLYPNCSANFISWLTKSYWRGLKIIKFKIYFLHFIFFNFLHFKYTLLGQIYHIFLLIIFEKK